MHARTWAEKLAAAVIGSLGGVAIVLAIAACVPAPAIEGGTVKRETRTAFADGVTSITLQDGTRCVVYSGPEGRSGLDCDWRSTQPSTVER